VSAVGVVLEELVMSYNARRAQFIETWGEWDELTHGEMMVPVTAEKVMAAALSRLRALDSERFEAWEKVHPFMSRQVAVD